MATVSNKKVSKERMHYQRVCDFRNIDRNLSHVTFITCLQIGLRDQRSSLNRNYDFDR